MKVLVIGSGGREHSIVWKIRQSKLVSEVWCAPANAGISQIARVIDIAPTDIDRLIDFCRSKDIDLTIVGPEAPLVKGIVDRFTARGLSIFGPSSQASQLEGSKIFAKQIMKKYSIPTADYHILEDYHSAYRYIADFFNNKKERKLVIKADGLAAGKGVVIVQTKRQAEEVIDRMMIKKRIGTAGTRLIIEEYLEGRELSFIGITDGRKFLPLSQARDYKQLCDNNYGPNTGGMGAYSPVSDIDEALAAKIHNQIVLPLLHCLNKEGIVYKGILYIGLMLTPGGPKVLEFNVRLGDPEAQVILPRLKTDLLDIFYQIARGEKLGNLSLEWKSESCICVVLVSQGYPENPEKGYLIQGLEELNKLPDIIAFHSGTSIKRERHREVYITNGGRVLGISGLGSDIHTARDKVYAAVKCVRFAGMHYRSDIALQPTVYNL